MFSGRQTTDSIEGHERITRLFLVISADGVITREERREYAAVSARQKHHLLALDVWAKWGVRAFRRGFTRKSYLELGQDLADVERTRPASGLVDPYGVMAAE